MGELEPDKPFYLNWQDLKTLKAAQIMEIAQRNGYAWLLPLVKEKELTEATEGLIEQAQRILEKNPQTN